MPGRLLRRQASRQCSYQATPSEERGSKGWRRGIPFEDAVWRGLVGQLLSLGVELPEIDRL